MKGLWLEENVLRYREDIPDPELPAGEALVRVRMAGICATDLELVGGYYPYSGVLGHEFVGEIVLCPDDPGRVGERVVGEINAVCWECAACVRGDPTHCLDRTVLGIVGRNGCFAEFLILPLENLHRVPDSISDENAVFVEPLAAACEILEQIKIQPTDRVLVVGAGRLGQLIAQTIRQAGSELAVVARYPRQKELLERFSISTLSEDEIEAGSFDIVIEATGVPAGFAAARSAVRPRGILVLKSTYRGEVSVDFSSLVVDEITLLGSRCGPYKPALALLESGVVDPGVLIDAVYPLSSGLMAMDQAGQSGVMKIMLEIQG